MKPSEYGDDTFKIFIRISEITNTMELKILHLSDTHGVHRHLRELPEADILVHSGDFTMSGSEAETLDFLEWVCDLPYRHKVLVAGNHDACLYGAHLDGLDDNVHYLCGSGVEIEGLKFWGVPMFMEDCLRGKQEQLYAAIPEDTDVLVTHTPPLAYSIRTEVSCTAQGSCSRECE